MVSSVENTQVKQKDREKALVVAITSSAAFETGQNDDVYKEGVAFPLLQAMQRVNERLLEENPAEELLFDVVLITTSTQQQQKSSCITSTTRHYGLDVSRFCFSCEEDFVETLLENNVSLFLTASQNEAEKASLRGVTSALLSGQTAAAPSEQLRILFCGDSLMQEGAFPPSVSQSFVTQIGEMRSRFSAMDSPLTFIMVTSRGDRENGRQALEWLRTRGIKVDEAYCLAGAPRHPIINLLRHHFLLSSSVQT
ncbi:cytosolic 5'-nucleotidase 1B isoform 1-T1 [Synchiropus picturatus]